MAVKEEQKKNQGGFWSYLKHKDMDFFPSGGLRWWTLFLLVFLWTVQQFEAMKMGPVLVFLLEEFNVSLQTWGYLAAVAAGVGAIAAFYLGILSDRIGRRSMMIWPCLIYVFVAIGTALSPNWIILSIFYILGVSVVNGIGPAVSAACRDITPQMGRAMVFGWLGLAFTLGTLLANLVASITIPIWPGWRSQYWIAAVFALVILIVMVIFYRDLSPRIRGQIVKDQMDALSTSLDSSGFDLAEAQKRGSLIYRDVRIWLLCGAMIFWAAPYVSVAYYVPMYLTVQYGVEPSKASIVTTFFWLLFTVSLLFSGWLSDKMRVRKTVTAFGGLTTGIAFFIAAALPQGTSFGTLVFWWSVVGFFSGFIYPAYCAILSENAEEISPFAVGRVFGMLALVSTTGMFILNFGLPWVVARWGWPTWMGPFAGISCILIGTLMAAGRGPWWPQKESKVTRAA